MGDFIVSNHNEIMLPRNAAFADVVEQLNPFFMHHLVLIDDKRINTVDKLEHHEYTLMHKVPDKERWIFAYNNTTYTVFDEVAANFMQDTTLADLLIPIDDDSKSTSDDTESSDVDLGSDDSFLISSDDVPIVEYSWAKDDDASLVHRITADMQQGPIIYN